MTVTRYASPSTRLKTHGLVPHESGYQRAACNKQLLFRDEDLNRMGRRCKHCENIRNRTLWRWRKRDFRPDGTWYPQ